MKIMHRFKNLIKALNNAKPNFVLSESLGLDKCPRSISYTLSKKGKCLAQISGHFESRQIMKIDFMDVDSKLQRQGIGSGLLLTYIEYAKDKNVQEIHVKSARTWQAISFYSRHGFKFIGQKNLLIKRLCDNTNQKSS
ncbi:MAG: GNAT family N-acetyltransferase [Rickettsiales bacterium]|jgi:N-acetylglutamate synthase-like GNAT family acetyltransferase|nr:GNAT family N-acetyltransferase [Rickettsiales bacterium]